MLTLILTKITITSHYLVVLYQVRWITYKLIKDNSKKNKYNIFGQVLN